MKTKFLGAVSALGLLAACSSGGGGTSTTTPPTPEQFEQQIRDSLGFVQEIASFSPTAFDAMPTSGQATFRGDGVVFIDPEPARDRDDIFLLGDATMTARFGSGKMTGTITNLVGGKGDSIDNIETFIVGGQINIGENLSIIGNDFDDNLTNDPNDWYADAKGRLTTPDGVYTVEGDIEGKFLGTRVNNPTTNITTKAIAGLTSDAFATRNGQAVPAEIEIYGTHNP